MQTPSLTQNTREMSSLQNFQPATFESVWAALQENERIMRENERKFKEERAESERYLREMFAESERLTKERERILSEKFAETELLIKANAKEISGIGNSNGEVAESYFISRFAKNPQFAGQNYESFTPNLRKKITSLNLQGEYDLVLYNCTSVAIIEIKYKAKKEDIETLLNKVQSFKQLFPEYANFNIYLGLAGLHVNVTAEKEAIKQGVAVIKQVGKKMVVHDAHLRVF
jgi:hypothetical protein